ncbi:MAG TPA: DUF2948 family protein [Caulobacteraceae bacterium]|jgi:hypothetical protein
MAQAGARPLRLLAEDADDLQVISAALQDAIVKVGDILHEPQARRLTVVLNRFRWESSRHERVRAALQLGGVLDVKSRRIRREAKTAVLSLLAVTFEPNGDAEDPGGTLVLTFAGGGDLRADVEALDAVLADLSAPWPTPRAPRHADS